MQVSTSKQGVMGDKGRKRSLKSKKISGGPYRVKILPVFGAWVLVPKLSDFLRFYFCTFMLRKSGVVQHEKLSNTSGSDNATII